MSFYYLKREGTNETFLGGQATSLPTGLAPPMPGRESHTSLCHSLGSHTSPLGKQAYVSLAQGCQVPGGLGVSKVLDTSLYSPSDTKVGFQ